MRCNFFRVTTALAVLGVAGKAIAQDAPCVDGAGARYKVVYQLSEGIDQAMRAIGGLYNYLNGTPGTKIVVAALGHDIGFLIEGAKDMQGCPFDAPMAALASMGAESRVCYNLLTTLKVPEDKLLFGAEVVPVGVMEITHLQQEEGFTCIKP